MSDLARYRLNEPHVIGEVLEGELVLVHFASGLYFSLRGTGADICNLLLAGCTVGQATERLASHHGISAEPVRAALEPFIAQLVAEELLTATTGASASDSNICPVAAEFSPPVLEKYSDMADQLLLDPIHEIDQSDWSRREAA